MKASFMELHCQPNECFKNTLIQILPDSLPGAVESVSQWVLKGRRLPLPHFLYCLWSRASGRW